LNQSRKSALKRLLPNQTALLKGFVRKPFSEAYAPTTKPFSVVNTVEIQGSEKHLVLQEFGSQYEGDVLSSRKKIEQCDLFALFTTRVT
jgi:mitochondrial Rho GTPase 1